MPTARYTALSSEADHEDHAPPRDDMEAAFDYSDDEDDEPSESHPLNPTPTSPSRFSAPAAQPHPPGTYDFERVDYDYPPPGSPPLPSATALPNDFGNSNGFIPSESSVPRTGPRRNWFQRSAAAILPNEVATRIGILPQRPNGPVGGGVNNDGVFANVTAKPNRPVRVQEGDDTYVVPEDSRSDAPPSYAAAQADAVPTYWETTVHAPFAPGMAGEIMVDSLPTGSLFSFLWNMLVSISFQFVGFLLTYLLHTTHAARLGSRAGLGVTLIQYGFALRSNKDNADQTGEANLWGMPTRPYDGFSTNSTSPDEVKSLAEQQVDQYVADATTEWLSFFLMTVGWFILLTSLLGYWRVKRWESSILASQRDNSSTPAPAAAAESSATPFSLLSRVDNTFALRGSSRLDVLRAGFGLGNRHDAGPDDQATRRAEEGESMLIDPTNPQHREILENDRRLERNLRDAGFI